MVTTDMMARAERLRYAHEQRVYRVNAAIILGIIEDLEADANRTVPDMRTVERIEREIQTWREMLRQIEQQ